MAGLESMAMVVEEVKPAEKPVDREKVGHLFPGLCILHVLL